MPRPPRLAPLQIVWFKRDLRIADHAALAEAARHGPVLPLYIVEPQLWRQPDASARQYAFVCDSLRELDRDLAHLGQPLVVRVGDAVDVLTDIAAQAGIGALWSHQETGNDWTYARDRRVAAWAKARSLPWHQPRQNGVVRRLRSRDGWARRWDAEMSRPALPTPAALAPYGTISSDRLPDAHELGLPPDPIAQRQPGGRTHAAATLQSFLATRGLTYRRAMSTPLAGALACSRLSPHLAWGTMSLREVTQATWARLGQLRDSAEPEANQWRGALVSFAGRLHWHCHFMQKLEDEPSIEFTELHPSALGLRPADPDAVRLAAWSNGETGYPFFDASMRCLRATGWLNFRARAMLMSFASYNLWLPWRDTGLVLARLFTDYEPGIHWPQAQMQSGTTGINTIRIYNVVKQGRDHDPDGRFVRRWIPELAAVPDAFLHTPWQWDGATGFIGSRYPAPIVDLAASTAAAKEMIYGARRSPAFAPAADAIQNRHGSRRSGLPMTGRRKPRKRSSQLELDI